MNKKNALIIIHGFPATGKTALSKEISDFFKFPVFCADEIKEIIFERIGRFDENLFDPISKASYDLMYHFAYTTLSKGQSCIIEAFLKKEMAEPEINKIKNKLRCQIIQIHLMANPDLIKKRYEKRIADRKRHFCHPKDIPFNEFAKLKGRSQKINTGGKFIAINTTDFKKVNIKKILFRVKNSL